MLGERRERAQPGALARRRDAQAGGDQDAVLVDERHQVGDRAERDQIEQVARIEARGVDARRRVRSAAAR